MATQQQEFRKRHNQEMLDRFEGIGGNESRVPKISIVLGVDDEARFVFLRDTKLSLDQQIGLLEELLRQVKRGI